MNIKSFLSDPRLRFVILAAFVVAFLYFFVMERDRLISWAGGSQDPVARQDDVASDDADLTETAQQNAAMQQPAQRGVGVPVSTRSYVSQPLKNAVLLRGVTEAKRRITVQAETSGKVVSAMIPKGTQIREGDILCKIDPATRFETLADMQARLSSAQAQIQVTEARILEAEARLREAEINENAAQKLSTDGFASETRLAGAQAAKVSSQAALSAAIAGRDAALSAVESARSAVANAQEEIDRLTVVAPFDGLLEADTAEPGQFLAAGNPQSAKCTDIVDISTLRLVGYVSELDVRFVKEGAVGAARLNASDADVQGIVAYVAKSADPVTRTFEVEIEIENSDLAIRAGETAEIMISANDVSAHLIPPSSLTLNDQGILGVRIAQGQFAKFVPVSVIRDEAEGMWVSGLPDAVDLIVVGHELVRDGSSIIPVKKES